MKETGIKLDYCAFMYHNTPFRHTYKSGLETYIIRLQTEGLCQALIAGQVDIIEPGDLLLFSPGEVYDLRIGELGPSGDYYVICSGPWLDEWWKLQRRPQKTKIGENGRIAALWQQLILESRRHDGGNPELLCTLMQSLCYLLDRAIDEATSYNSGPKLLSYKIKLYIEEHAAIPFTLSDVAKHTGLSVSRSVQLFKAEFGMSIMQYAQKVRLAMALELMGKSPLTLERIAEETGFGSYTYFHRVFKRYYGISPGAYRKQMTEKQ